MTSGFRMIRVGPKYWVVIGQPISWCSSCRLPRKAELPVPASAQVDFHGVQSMAIPSATIQWQPSLDPAYAEARQRQTFVLLDFFSPT